MGQLAWPPYEAYRDNTQEWQDFAKLLHRQLFWQAIVFPVGLALFCAVLILWIVAFSGSS